MIIMVNLNHPPIIEAIVLVLRAVDFSCSYNQQNNMTCVICREFPIRTGLTTEKNLRSKRIDSYSICIVVVIDNGEVSSCLLFSPEF
jgi:hypothetical protein